jgi:hypothetical protein
MDRIQIDTVLNRIEAHAHANPRIAAIVHRMVRDLIPHDRGPGYPARGIPGPASIFWQKPVAPGWA